MLAVQEPVPGLLGADAGVPLGGERASGHPAGRARPTAAARKRSTPGPRAARRARRFARLRLLV